MSRYTALLLCLCASFLLTNCMTMSDRDRKIVICNELRSQIVFSGSSNDLNPPDLQYSDRALAQRNYNNYGCDKI